MLSVSDGPSLKRIARSAVIDKPCWDNVKSTVMFHIDLMKFVQNPVLAKQLLATETRPLVENIPHDHFWGIPNNAAGHCVMGCRLQLASKNVAPPFIFLSDILAEKLHFHSNLCWNMNVPRLTLDFVHAVAPIVLENSSVGIAMLVGFVDTFNEDFSLNPVN